MGKHPIHPLLVEAARGAGKAEITTQNSVWDGLRFTNLFADPEQGEWTRNLDEIEMVELLAFSLGLS